MPVPPTIFDIDIIRHQNDKPKVLDFAIHQGSVNKPNGRIFGEPPHIKVMVVKALFV
jgi:hypothetical protein